MNKINFKSESKLKRKERKMSSMQEDKSYEKRNGLYLLKIESDDEEMKNHVNVKLNEEELKTISKQLNWTSYSFDEYMDGLIAPIALQSPLKNEKKLSDIVTSKPQSSFPKLQLPSNINEILEQEFYIVNKTKNSSIYPPSLQLKKRFIVD